MFDKIKKIIIFSVPALSLFCWTGQASAYRVSGVVEFTYRSYETKTGNAVSSDRYWIQFYRADLSTHVWDPRFMRFYAGIGYTAISHHSGVGTDNLNYNVNTTFFPAMKISWDLFGRKNIQNVESTATIAGYDITSTSYGGTIRINLNAQGRGNNNNNNNNRNGKALNLPSINLSHYRTESESLGTVNLINETLDDTKASLAYHINTLFSLNADAGLQSYENLINNSTYEYKTANLFSLISVSPNGELKLSGNVTDREARNIAGLDETNISQNYAASLEFKEKDRIKHEYRYTYSRLENGSTDLTTQKAIAQITYRLSEEWLARAGLQYNLADFRRPPNPATSDPGEKNLLKSGNLTAGANYTKRYAPDFLGPFVFVGGYDFESGFSSITSETGGTEGDGWYYDNRLNLRLNSAGWKEDNATLDYTIDSRRDYSPVDNDVLQQSLRLSLSTTRVPRTSIRGTAGYLTQDIRSSGTGDFLTVLTSGTSGVSQNRRSLTYDLNLDHFLFAYLTLSEGATRGQSKQNTYSLLASVPYTSSVDDVDTTLYATLNFNYPITRFLLYRAQLRDEYRRTERLNLVTTGIQSYEVKMYLDYRIRMIFVNLEYRWRQDNPKAGLQTEQQFYFVKLSRPF